jgi:Na+-transporting methylmalonyl-CoA/oxaloacetate decarboxylase gamma subunit
MIAPKTIALIAAMSLIGSVAPAAFAENETTNQANVVNVGTQTQQAAAASGNDNNVAAITIVAVNAQQSNNNS